MKGKHIDPCRSNFRRNQGFHVDVTGAQRVLSAERMMAAHANHNVELPTNRKNTNTEANEQTGKNTEGNQTTM